MVAARRLYVALLALWVISTAATAWLVPQVFGALAARPVAWLATALFLAGLFGSGYLRSRGRDLPAFVASGAFILGILAATAACVYPNMIRSAGDPSRSLTALNASASAHALATGLWWWPAGFVIAVGYTALVLRLHRGKVRIENNSGY